jgi:hypothetical protein
MKEFVSCFLLFLLLLQCSDLSLFFVLSFSFSSQLFGMGALLFNRAPGIKFFSCDLVRNLLFSNFLDLPTEDLDALYIDLWLPLQSNFRMRIDAQQLYTHDMDDFLRAYVEDVATRAPREQDATSAAPFLSAPPRYVSTFEQTLNSMVSMAPSAAMTQAGNTDSGIFFYARFVSFYEAYLSAQGVSVVASVRGLLRDMRAFRDRYRPHNTAD